MPFSQLSGYEPITRVFTRTIEREAYHSAYLFHGPAGVGKRRLAKAFAKAMFCQRLKGDFCGECSACKRMESGRFPDYRVIEPDGAYIKIGQLRDMMREAAVQPYEAKRKVFVIDPAHQMRPEAANSVLKVLEEPFAFSIFILITSSPEAILPTIDSRCQKIRFSPLPYDALAGQLQREHDLGRKTAATLARVSGGRPGLAVELMQGDFTSDRDSVIEHLAALAEHRDLEALRLSQHLRSKRDDVQKFLLLLVPVLRDAALLKDEPESEQLLNLDRREDIQRATASIAKEDLVSAWHEATECSMNVQQMANPQAQVERCLMALCPVSGRLPGDRL